MILGIDLLKALVLKSELYYHIIEADDGYFKGYKAPMVDLGTYEFKYLNTGNITPEEQFTNAYAEEIKKPEPVCTYTKQLHVILYAK